VLNGATTQSVLPKIDTSQTLSDLHVAGLIYLFVKQQEFPLINKPSLIESSAATVSYGLKSSSSLFRVGQPSLQYCAIFYTLGLIIALS